MIHLLELSTPKLVAVLTLGASIAGQIVISARAIFAEVPVQGWQQISVVTFGGLAIMWLLRERENDKKEREKERAEHKATVNQLVAKLEKEQEGLKHFMSNVVTANTKALKDNAAATAAQNKHFESIVKKSVEKAFSDGEPEPKTKLP